MHIPSSVGAGDSLKLGVGGGKGQVPLLLKIDKEWDAIPVSQLADIQRDVASILNKSELVNHSNVLCQSLHSIYKLIDNLLEYHNKCH